MLENVMNGQEELFGIAGTASDEPGVVLRMSVFKSFRVHFFMFSDIILDDCCKDTDSAL